MPKVNTVVTFNVHAIRNVLAQEAHGSEEFTYVEVYDKDTKFDGFALSIPVTSNEGVTVRQSVVIDKKETDNLFTISAKKIAKAEGAVSSAHTYVFNQDERGRVESVEIILNAITRQ